MTPGGLAILVALGTPAVLAALLLLPAGSRLRALATHLAPWAAAPALLLAVPAVFPEARLELPWVLLGAELALTDLTRGFLLPAALIWLAAGQHAAGYLRDDPARRRFDALFLMTLAGNLGLLWARDVPTFYLCFALMTFAAYGLVVHAGTPEARRAGRIYVVLAVLGEGALLAGLVFAARAADSLAIAALPTAIAASPDRDLIVALLYAGFGVKAGALLLHVWLPLAHPVAPTPASAVLSGVMIKAGLLGWLQFLPAGVAALPGWGVAVAVLGLVAAFYAVAIGLTETDPKTVLAYSSVSQMGLMMLFVAVALASPAAARPAAAAAAFYALHHGIAKAALFLGVAAAGDGRVRRMWLTAGLVLPALALAGAPLTSGALAKSRLAATGATESLGLPDLLLYASATATTLLLARFLWTVLIAPRNDAHGPLPWRCHAAWLALVVASLAVPWLLARDLAASAVGAGALWSAAWPVLLGGGLAAFALARSRGSRGGWTIPVVPAGDVLALVAPLGAPLGRWLRTVGTAPWVLLAAGWERVRTGWQSRRAAAMRSATAAEWRLRRGAGVIALLLLIALGALAA